MSDRPVFSMSPIGFARTTYELLSSTPVQSAINMATTGIIDIDPEYKDALDGLSGFDYLWLITWLGGTTSEPVSLRQVPFLLQGEQRALGILATRGPRRINAMGLSLVRLDSVQGTTIYFGGVDVVNGTPILDIKPYVDKFDYPGGDVRCGWIDNMVIPPGATPESLTQSVIEKSG